MMKEEHPAIGSLLSFKYDKRLDKDFSCKSVALFYQLNEQVGAEMSCLIDHDIDNPLLLVLVAVEETTARKPSITPRWKYTFLHHDKGVVFIYTQPRLLMDDYEVVVS